MVVNPIYEGGETIYEEIPGELDYKAQPEPLPFEREEGYVSISTSATLNNAAEKVNAASCEGLVASLQMPPEHGQPSAIMSSKVYSQTTAHCGSLDM